MTKRSIISVDCNDQKCSLFCQGHFVPAEVMQDRSSDDKIDILYVGEGPGVNEAKQRIPFIGVAGSLLRRILHEIKRGEYNVAFSNAVRCRSVDRDDQDTPPSNEEVRRCRHFLIRDIEVLDPEVVVLLGAVAVKAILGEDRSISEERGQYRMMKLGGRERVVLATWHPSYVNRQKNTLSVYLDDLRLAFKLADGWRPPVEWSRLGKSTLLRTVKEVNEYCDHLQRGLPSDAMVSVDVETKNLNKVYGNQLGMIQFAHNMEEAACIPLNHPQTPFDTQEVIQIKDRLQVLFEDPVSFRYWLAHGGLFEQIQIGHHILRRGNEKLRRTFRNVPMIDTMAFGYLLNENKVNIGDESFGLKPMSRRYLQYTHYDDATLEARSQGGLLDLPLVSPVPMGQPGWLPNLTDYGGMDVYVALRLFQALKEEAIEQRYFKKSMMLLELLFSRVYRLISVIERNGFWADLDHLRMLQNPKKSPILLRLREIDHARVSSMKDNKGKLLKVARDFESAQRCNEKLCSKASGGSQPLFDLPWILDLNKPDHVRAWLIDECKLEALEKTETGKPSVGKQFFAKYDSVAEVALVKERRGLSKLATSYTNQLIEYLDPKEGEHEDCKDGRIRCDIHFTSTVTGRASSSNPNMQQQVKADSPEKAAIKAIFRAEQPGVQDTYKIDFRKGPPKAQSTLHLDPKYALVQLDFRTNEVVWWAISAQCPDLARALVNGKTLREEYRANPTPELKERARIEGDLHRQTASIMYSVPVYEATDDHRQHSKSIVFGWMFGRGNKAIAAQIKKPVDETSRLIQMFGDQFPVGRDYLHGLPDVARKQHYVDSLIGRRRHLPGYVLWDDALFQGQRWHDDEEETEESKAEKDLRKFLAELNRQAMNSGIQGIASDAAFIGAAIFMDWIENHGKDEWLIQNVVHDSCVYQVPIVEIEESIRVAEASFTTEVMKYMTSHWGVNFLCPIDVEFEVGLDWGHLAKWDGSPQNLDQIIKNLTAPKIDPVKKAI